MRFVLEIEKRAIAIIDAPNMDRAHVLAARSILRMFLRILSALAFLCGPVARLEPLVPPRTKRN
jgi:hypothetical protein